MTNKHSKKINLNKYCVFHFTVCDVMIKKLATLESNKIMVYKLPNS